MGTLDVGIGTSASVHLPMVFQSGRFQTANADPFKMLE